MNKNLVAAAVAATLVAPTAVQAVKYKLSGQINRVVQYQDDGETSDIQFYDNNASNSRWRLLGSEDIGNGIKVGFTWEWAARSNGKSAPMRSADTGFTQDLRKSEVWFSGNWGKVSLGKGDGAGNGTTEMDLSTTWNASAYVARGSFATSTAWRTGQGGVVAPGLTHGVTATYFDAFSRYNRMRYDTPSIGPVTIAASVGQADLWEVAARLSQGIAGGQLSAGLFYGESGGGIASAGEDNRWGGSLAYLFSQGTNFALSYSEREGDTPAGSPSGAPPILTTDEGDSWYVKVAHNWGNNSASIGYGETTLEATLDGVAAETEDSGFNIGFNHNIPKAKVDVYASYHWSELDITSTGPVSAVDIEDIQGVLIGTKLKFD